jgi:hypothetical protein
MIPLLIINKIYSICSSRDPILGTVRDGGAGSAQKRKKKHQNIQYN